MKMIQVILCLLLCYSGQASERQMLDQLQKETFLYAESTGIATMILAAADGREIARKGMQIRRRINFCSFDTTAGRDNEYILRLKMGNAEHQIKIRLH